MIGISTERSVPSLSHILVLETLKSVYFAQVNSLERLRRWDLQKTGSGRLEQCCGQFLSLHLANK